MKQNFSDIKIDILTTEEALNLCGEYFESDKLNKVFFINSHCYNISRKNYEYKNAINNADLLLNDGIGVKLGLKIFNIEQRENMNGTDFIPKIVKLANDTNKNIYLLGGKPGIVELVEKNIKSYYPKCNIVGKHHGYFKESDKAKVINDIVSRNTELLIIGMGVPIQELWIHNNEKMLTNVKIAVAGGAILDFMSGNIKRAPIILRKYNLEWLYRLYLEPKRLFKRYVIGNFQFIYYVFKEKIKRLYINE